MRLIDISLPLSGSLPVWPGDPKVQVTRLMSIEAGDNANVSHLNCSVHSGTHIDAPVHFVPGALTADRIPLDVFVGPVEVHHLPDVAEVTPNDLVACHLPSGTERLLLRTRNSENWARGTTEFDQHYVALTPDAAQWVVRRGLRLIGIDYLSVQRFSDSEPHTHQTLLSAGVVVVEGLDLSRVQPGSYQLICLPLKIQDSDGAPVRAALVQE
jgi:arylformamidase